MAGPLDKLKLLSFKDETFKNPRGVYIAYFNPDSFSETYSVTYTDAEGEGGVGSDAKYSKTLAKTYSFNLIIDGTGSSGLKLPVLPQIELFKEMAYNYVGEIHRPPYLILNWGPKVEKCVLTSLTIDYTLFDPVGMPLRATLKTKFKEVLPFLLRKKILKINSPDLTHSRIVKEGDTLPLLCEEIYGDPKLYLKVAEVNKLTNYRELVPGTEVILPPIIEE